MGGVYGLGSPGGVPHAGDEAIKQAKYSDIKSRAGRIAHHCAAGGRAGKPTIEEGIKPAKGALKWIAKLLEEENQ